MENFRNKQFISFKFCTILSSVMRSWALLHCSLRNNHPFVQCIHIVYALRLSLSSHLGYQMDCHGARMLAFKQPLFYLVRAPKYKSSDAGNLDRPKKSQLSNVCMYRKTYSICKVQNSAVSGIHWKSWNVSLMDKEGLLIVAGAVPPNSELRQRWGQNFHVCATTINLEPGIQWMFTDPPPLASSSSFVLLYPTDRKSLSEGSWLTRPHCSKIYIFLYLLPVRVDTWDDAGQVRQGQMSNKGIKFLGGNFIQDLGLTYPAKTP